MFAHLAQLTPRIVVTGPQRSGTTICAQMIAYDTGFQFIDETVYGVDDELSFRRLLGRKRIVIQAPALLKTICDYPPAATVVLMRRPIEEIHASEERIGWNYNWLPVELGRFGLTEGDVAEVKYAYWDKHHPLNHIEVQYHRLEGHPFWVPAEKRTEFTAKQTGIEML